MASETLVGRVLRSAGVGLATGLGTAATGRLPSTPTALVVGVLLGGVVAAGGVRAAVGSPDASAADAAPRPHPPTARDSAGAVLTALGVGAVLGAATGASLRLSLALDAAAVEWLRRRGVARPRPALAVGLGVAAGVLDWVDALGPAPTSTTTGPRPGRDPVPTVVP